jgi:hypothetical protein
MIGDKYCTDLCYKRKRILAEIMALAE